MNRDQTARALLRLYPAAWRERYGEELLALVDESGLTFRVVLNVMMAATVERLRMAAWLINHEHISGDQPLPSLITLGYLLADFLPRAAILCTTILALRLAGIPTPPWTTWVVLFFRCEEDEFMAPRLKSRAARLFIWSYWLFLAMALTALAGLLGVTLRRVGVPEPSTTVFYRTLGTVLAVGLVRAIPMRYQWMSYNSTWPGIHPREIRVWQVVWFAVCVVTALAYPGPEMFWPGTLILWLVLRPPFGLTREGIAQQRAFKAEMDRKSPWGRF
jgi:hypothetical protein